MPGSWDTKAHSQGSKCARDGALEDVRTRDNRVGRAASATTRGLSREATAADGRDPTRTRAAWHKGRVSGARLWRYPAGLIVGLTPGGAS